VGFPGIMVTTTFTGYKTTGYGFRLTFIGYRDNRTRIQDLDFRIRILKLSRDDQLLMMKQSNDVKAPGKIEHPIIVQSIFYHYTCRNSFTENYIVGLRHVHSVQ
jgi:hypothetical protein